jgi:excisionase family DNA binding protein
MTFTSIRSACDTRDHEKRKKHPPRKDRTMATSTTPMPAENLLTPSEVATLFRVDPKTVTRWAQAGKVPSIRTLGGHRRYRESDIRALLEDALNPEPGH